MRTDSSVLKALVKDAVGSSLSDNSISNPEQRRKELITDLKQFGDEAKELDTSELDEDSLEAALYAFSQQVNLVNEVNCGAPPEGIRKLADLISLDKFDVNSVFDETGSYVDYELVNEVYNKLIGII